MLFYMSWFHLLLNVSICLFGRYWFLQQLKNEIWLEAFMWLRSRKIQPWQTFGTPHHIKNRSPKHLTLFFLAHSVHNHHEKVTALPSGITIIFKLGDRNLKKVCHAAKWQFSHGGEWKVDSDPLPILESFRGVNWTFCVVQTANGWRDTLFGDKMPVPAIVQRILEPDAVGVAEGLATAHAHVKLQEGWCWHMKVPGLCVTRFSCTKGNV